MNLTSLLHNFHSAILDNNEEAIMPALKENGRLSPKEQMAIYIEGYRLRLVQAIRSDYPALIGFLGNKTFDELALLFVETNPPRSFNLDRYPHKFPGFLNKHIDGFAVEAAILESAIAEVFMMEESEPFTSENFALLNLEQFAALHLLPRKAGKMLEFKYNANAWLNESRSGNINAEPKYGESFLYVYRHNNNVQRSELSQEQYALLSNIFSGQQLENALENTVELYPEQTENIIANLSEWFKQWTMQGFFSGLPIS